MLKNLLLFFLLTNVFSMDPEEALYQNLKKFEKNGEFSRLTGIKTFSPLNFYQKFGYILQNVDSTIGMTLIPFVSNLLYRQFADTENLLLLKILNLFSLGLPLIGLSVLYLQNEFQIKKLQKDDPDHISCFEPFTTYNLEKNPWHILTVPMDKRLRLINVLTNPKGTKILQKIDTYKSIEILNQIPKKAWSLIENCSNHFVKKIFTIMTVEEIKNILTAGVEDNVDQSDIDAQYKNDALNLIDDNTKKKSILDLIGSTHSQLKKKIEQKEMLEQMKKKIKEDLKQMKEQSKSEV